MPSGWRKHHRELSVSRRRGGGTPSRCTCGKGHGPCRDHRGLRNCSKGDLDWRGRWCLQKSDPYKIWADWEGWDSMQAPQHSEYQHSEYKHHGRHAEYVPQPQGSPHSAKGPWAIAAPPLEIAAPPLTSSEVLAEQLISAVVAAFPECADSIPQGILQKLPQNMKTPTALESQLMIKVREWLMSHRELRKTRSYRAALVVVSNHCGAWTRALACPPALEAPLVPEQRQS
eukprot:TRINITY_DN37830_c0_g1_i2.p1 TRINITY_DN37830_c0_g1~~TRINITY_DN37830_c0_g1_i2.p1  ORF type:complete len:229 (+),score=5.84 TRINITY_DN37830_c0_g1_i2:187-873(+)